MGSLNITYIISTPSNGVRSTVITSSLPYWPRQRLIGQALCIIVVIHIDIVVCNRRTYVGKKIFVEKSKKKKANNIREGRRRPPLTNGAVLDTTIHFWRTILYLMGVRFKRLAGSRSFENEAPRTHRSEHQSTDPHAHWQLRCVLDYTIRAT